MRARVFVGSSGEALEICRAIQAELSDSFDVTIWNQDVISLSFATLDSLLDRLDSSDAGIFVLRPDDFTSSRGVVSPTVRDNVLLELGMFLGRLGRNRTFMLVPDSPGLRLPSDLEGITTARYDSSRFDRGDERAALGPACRQVRHSIRSVAVRTPTEPNSHARLERAMRRMSKDLEYLLSNEQGAIDVDDGGFQNGGEFVGPAHLRIGRAEVTIELGRIQDFTPSDSRTTVALPANEYFDDECLNDANSSLGAYVQHHFANRTREFATSVRAELADIPCQRVPRADRRIDDSYGIGQAIYLSRLALERRIILVAATTERTGIGLRAEPHFLYAALEGIVEVMNENRLNSVTFPVLGAGHGGIPLPIALLFNLFALRSIVTDDRGLHLRKARIVVFERGSGQLKEPMMESVLARLSAR